MKGKKKSEVTEGGKMFLRILGKASKKKTKTLALQSHIVLKNWEPAKKRVSENTGSGDEEIRKGPKEKV